MRRLISVTITCMVAVLSFAACQANSHDQIPEARNVLKTSSALLAPATPAPNVSAFRKPGHRSRRQFQLQQGSDFTDDVCSSYCVVQSQTLTIPFGYSWYTGPANAYLQIFVVNSTPGLSIAFSPTNLSYPFITSLEITASPTLKPGTYKYSYYGVFTRGTDYKETTAIVSTTIYVACSDNLMQCPQLSIFDQLASSSSTEVDGNPPTLMSVPVGKEMKLTLATKSGTGSGTYAIDTGFPTPWTVPGTPIKGYDIKSSTVTNLSAYDMDQKTIDFYWWRGSDPVNGDTVTAGAYLNRSDGDETAYVEAHALYLSMAPTSTNYQLDTEDPAYDNSVDPYEFGEGIRGTVGVRGSPGFRLSFTATTPAAGAGQFASTPRIFSTLAWSPDIASYNHGSGGQTDLYNCVFAVPAIAVGSSTAGTLSYSVKPSVNMGRFATSPLTLAQREDFGDGHFMYRPAATAQRKSVWVPVGVISYRWGAAATRASTLAMWSPLAGPNGYPNAYSFENGAGDTADAPSQWSAVFNEPVWGPLSPAPAKCPLVN